MTTTISATELKNKISEVLNKVAFRGDVTIIERHGKPIAKIIPTEESDSERETNEILADKKLMKDLKEAEEDVKKELGIDVPTKTGRKSQASTEKFVKAE